MKHIIDKENKYFTIKKAIFNAFIHIWFLWKRFYKTRQHLLYFRSELTPSTVPSHLPLRESGPVMRLVALQGKSVEVWKEIPLLKGTSRCHCPLITTFILLLLNNELNTVEGRIFEWTSVGTYHLYTYHFLYLCYLH